VAGVAAFYFLPFGLRTPAASPAEAELTVSRAPRLGENAELIFRVWLTKEYPRENRLAMILMSLPKGITLVENTFTIDNNAATFRIVLVSELGLFISDYYADYVHFGLENVQITKQPLEVRGIVRAVESGTWNVVVSTPKPPYYSSDYTTSFLGFFVSENEANIQEGGYWGTPYFDNVKPAHVALSSSSVDIALLRP
jgi:hypothetical protein